MRKCNRKQSDPDWRSEAFIMVEFTNVLIGYTVTKRMMLPLAQTLLEKADRLLDGKLGRVSHTQVLTTAVRHRVTACDARFLALAECLGLRQRSEAAAKLQPCGLYLDSSPKRIR